MLKHETKQAILKSSMDTVLFVNATIGFSENHFLVLIENTLFLRCKLTSPCVFLCSFIYANSPDTGLSVNFPLLVNILGHLPNTEYYVSSPLWGRHIVFGSVIVLVVIASIIIVCVIPCKFDNF